MKIDKIVQKELNESLAKTFNEIALFCDLMKTITD